MADEVLSPLTKKNKEVLPWYDRHILEGMVQFGPDKDGFKVVVTPQAVKDLQEGTLAGRPNEVYGLLMGKVYEDQEGCFTVVSGAVYARHLRATPGHVELSHAEMGDLRREASRMHPTAEFIGWTHSHGSYIQYSKIDLDQQKSWGESHHIGILTFMNSSHKHPWAIAYRGPTSRPLDLTDTNSAGITPYFKPLGKNSFPSYPETEGNTETEQVLGDSTRPVQQNDQKIKTRIQATLWNNRLFLWLLVLLISWPLILTVILSLMLFNLNRNFGDLESRIGSLTPVQSSVASTNLPWNCDRQTGIAPLMIKCDGPIGPTIQGWVWNFGDGSPNLETNTVTHTYKQPGIYLLTLTVAFSSGNQSAGSLSIMVGQLAPTPTTRPTSTVQLTPTPTAHSTRAGR